MEKEKKDIAFSILLVAVSAVVFFVLGALASDIMGAQRYLSTEIEYIPKTTLATTTTSSVEGATVGSATEQMGTSRTTTTTITEGSSSDLIPINTATKEQLMSIDGIGETFAMRIIAYREIIGGFTNLEQLKEIDGIGEGRYKSWAPYLTLS